MGVPAAIDHRRKADATDESVIHCGRGMQRSTCLRMRQVHFQGVQNSPSRGALPVAFLEASQTPMEYLHSISAQVLLGLAAPQHLPCLCRSDHPRACSRRAHRTCTQLRAHVPQSSVPVQHRTRFFPLDSLHVCMQAYNGMNLLVGDLRAGSVAYLTNRGRGEALQGPKAIEVGAHGISNGVLGDRWPKVHAPGNLPLHAGPATGGVGVGIHHCRSACVPSSAVRMMTQLPISTCAGEMSSNSMHACLMRHSAYMLLARAQVERGLARLQALLQEGAFEGGVVPWEALFEHVLGDRQCCKDESLLPDTGMPMAVERAMSSIFVEQFSHQARVLLGSSSAWKTSAAHQSMTVQALGRRQNGHGRCAASHLCDLCCCTSIGVGCLGRASSC